MMPRRNLVLGALVAALFVGGCWNPAAPGLAELETDSDEESGEEETSADVEFRCDDLPTAAVGATFEYTPMLDMADDAGVTWSAHDLPEGLEIDASTGRIAGVPEVEGEAEIEVTIETDDDETFTTTCELRVGPALQVDIDGVLDSIPYCLRPGAQTLLDLVVPGTGDGSPITCAHDGGPGDGERPAGISVDLDSCEIEGVIEDDRLGTSVFVVRGEQSGASVYVPYCVTNDEATGYDVTVDHSGLGDATLVPIMRRYDPDAPIELGEDGDPRFEILDPDSCGTNACFYGYAFSVSEGSPFGGTPDLGPHGLLRDEDSDQPTGFFHALSWERSSPVEDAFRTRPWTVNLDLSYCIADHEGACDGDNIASNVGAELEVSILMIPD